LICWFGAVICSISVAIGTTDLLSYALRPTLSGSFAEQSVSSLTPAPSPRRFRGRPPPNIAPAMADVIMSARTLHLCDCAPCTKPS
jgi:hypothetical protein